jgi:hypothetical protein
VLALIVYQALLYSSVKGHAIKILNFILKLKRSNCARTDYLSGAISVKGHALKLLNLASVQVKSSPLPLWWDYN